MLCFDPSIRKCQKKLSLLYKKKHELEEKDENMQAIPGSELECLICQIDELIEGEYSRAVFNHYSGIRPPLIRIYTNEEIQWIDAFGDTYDQTSVGQRHALVGLIEGGSKYRFK